MAANALTRAFPKSPRLDKSARNGAQKSTIAFSFCFRNSIDPFGESIDVFLSERKKKKEGERERGTISKQMESWAFRIPKTARAGGKIVHSISWRGSKERRFARDRRNGNKEGTTQWRREVSENNKGTIQAQWWW